MFAGEDLKKNFEKEIEDQWQEDEQAQVTLQLNRKIPSLNYDGSKIINRENVCEIFGEQPCGDKQLYESVKNEMLDPVYGKKIQRIAILGQAQIGKSQLLKQLLPTIKKNYEYIFYVSLKDLDLSEEMNILQFLTYQSNLGWVEYSSDLDFQLFKRVVEKITGEEQEKVCIILDDFEKSNYSFQNYFYKTSPFKKAKAGYLVSNILRSWFRKGKKILLLSPWQYFQLRRVPELNPIEAVNILGIDFEGQKQINDAWRKKEMGCQKKECPLGSYCLGFTVTIHESENCYMCRVCHFRNCHHEIQSLCFHPSICTALIKHADAPPKSPYSTVASALLENIIEAFQQCPKSTKTFCRGGIGFFAWQQCLRSNFVFHESDLISSDLNPMEINLFFTAKIEMYPDRDGNERSIVFCFLHLLLQEFLAALWLLLSPSDELKSDLKKHKKIFKVTDGRFAVVYNFMSSICNHSTLCQVISNRFDKVKEKNLYYFSKFGGGEKKICSAK